MRLPSLEQSEMASYRREQKFGTKATSLRQRNKLRCPLVFVEQRENVTDKWIARFDPLAERVRQ